MTDALVPFDAGQLAGLSAEEQVDALAVAWRGWCRMDVPVTWAFGQALRDLRVRWPGREWRAEILPRIGISKSTAHRLMTFAGGYELSQLGTVRSVDEGLKALKAPEPTAPEPSEPAPAAATSTPAPVQPDPEADPEADPDPVPAVVVEPEPVVVDPVLVDDHEPVEPYPEAVAAEVAAEHELTPAELRDERLERLAIVTEDLKDDIVDHWARKHSEAAERHQRDARRHREDVAAVNGERRRRLAAERKLEDFIDALLAVPHGEGDAGIDDVLASRGIARKAA